MPSDKAASRHAPAVSGLFHNRDYLLIVMAGVISSIGTKVSQIALPLLALGLTQSPLWAGLLGAAQQLPYLLFSLPAGAWVDRLNRKRLLICCDIVRAVMFGSIPLAYALGALHIPHLLAAVFVAGTCTVLFEVADLAALPNVVAESQLARARSVSEGIEATATVIGPSIGGLIITLGRTTIGGSVLAYLADSISYLLSALALLSVRRPLHHQQPREHPPLHIAIGEGLRFLWGHATLRGLLVVTTTVNFLQAPLTLLVVLVAQRQLGLGPAQIGLLFGVAGGAAVLGSLAAGWVYRADRLRPIMLAALGSWAVSALTLALAADSLALAAGLALTHLFWPVYAVAVVSYRLAESPPHLQGRVISAFRALSYGAEPLGLAVGGALAAVVGPAPIFALIGAGLLICAVAALLFRPGARGYTVRPR